MLFKISVNLALPERELNDWFAILCHKASSNVGVLDSIWIYTVWILTLQLVMIISALSMCCLMSVYGLCIAHGYLRHCQWGHMAMAKLVKIHRTVASVKVSMYLKVDYWPIVLSVGYYSIKLLLSCQSMVSAQHYSELLARAVNTLS